VRPNITRDPLHPPARKIAEPNYTIRPACDSTGNASCRDRSRARDGKQKVHNTRHEIIVVGERLGEGLHDLVVGAVESPVLT
jgi:hypothetical protein